MLRSLVLSAVCAAVTADCPGGCTGHGLCSAHDECACDASYFGADCSLRQCPFDYAFVDTPLGDLNHDGSVGNTYVTVDGSTGYEMFPTSAASGGFAAQVDEAHFYMECSGKGSCDRSVGECVCFTGYTGSACQRSTCPHDCNGHGFCRTLREVAAGALSRVAVGSTGGNLILAGIREPFDYTLWDADKHQMCVCDAGFSGVDCSQRSCPRSRDPLTPTTQRWCGGAACTDEIQQFRLSSAGPTTYSVTFTDTRNNTYVAYATVDTSNNSPGIVPPAAGSTVPDPTRIADPTTNAGLIMAALRGVPGGVLQQIEVSAIAVASDNGGLARTFQITFMGLSGAQYPVIVAPTVGKGTVEEAPKTVAIGNKEDIECANRGICDTVSGQCKCFSGYYGVACEHQNALAQGTR